MDPEDHLIRSLYSVHLSQGLVATIWLEKRQRTQQSTRITLILIYENYDVFLLIKRQAVVEQVKLNYTTI